MLNLFLQAYQKELLATLAPCLTNNFEKQTSISFLCMQLKEKHRNKKKQWHTRIRPSSFILFWKEKEQPGITGLTREEMKSYWRCGSREKLEFILLYQPKKLSLLGRNVIRIYSVFTHKNVVLISSFIKLH